MRTGVESRELEVGCVVRHGDPISAHLSVIVRRDIQATQGPLANAQFQERRKYYGIVVDDEDPLMSLLFAEDVVLLASQPGDIGKMIADLSAEAGKYGLVMHPDETIILTNVVCRWPEQIPCRGLMIKVMIPRPHDEHD